MLQGTLTQGLLPTTIDDAGLNGMISCPSTFAEIVSQGEWMLFHHLLLIDEALTAHINGETENDILLITMPPRHGKSQLISRYLPAWFLWRWPWLNVILTSYSADFAKKWGRAAREAFTRACNIVPVSGLHPDKTMASEWETLNGGGMKTAGVGGDVTGRPADLLIGDDLIKNHEEAASMTVRESVWEWWRSTAYTRLEPGGKAVVIGTRWHREDYQSQILKGDEPVTHINLPAVAEMNRCPCRQCQARGNADMLGREDGEALWPQRWNTERLARRRRVVGDYWWFAEYQGRPTQHTKAEWPDSYFENVFVDRLPDRFEHCVIAIDPARGTGKKGCFLPDVLVGWAGNRYWVWADCERRPVEDAAVTAISKALTYDVDLVYVEGNGVQHLVAEVVKEVACNSGLPHLLVQSFDSVGNKSDRIRRIGPRLQDRQIMFLDCPGCRQVVEQLKEFPVGDYVDGPDALEMALRTVNRMAREKLDSQKDGDDYGDDDGETY